MLVIHVIVLYQNKFGTRREIELFLDSVKGRLLKNE